MTEVSKEIQYVGPDGRLTYEGMALLRSFGAPASIAWGVITGTLSAQTDLQTALDAKQDDLVSGTNIKTINGASILGSGDLAVTVTTTEVLNATAGATLGAVGTYAFLIHATANTTITPGSTYAGSALRYSGVFGTNSVLVYNTTTGAGTPSGTWRAMGGVTGGLSNFGATLFLRIS